MSNETQTIVTYKEIGKLHNLGQEGPSCFNGIVRVKKYKITIEPINESEYVILERLVTLYKNTTNHHHHESLERYAMQEMNVDLYKIIKEAEDE